jgi:hypothetical protein
MQLDSQRASAATAAKSGKTKGSKNNSRGAFNLSYFFLVKESLA